MAASLAVDELSGRLRTPRLRLRDRYILAMTPISPEQCIAGREVTEAQLSPDGSMVAYVMGGVGGTALMLSRLDGSPTRQLSTYPQPRAGRGLGGGCFCWAPDSMAIAYSGADGQLWWQPVPGGQVRRLTDHGADRVAQAPVITPDATAIVYVLDQAEVWLQQFNGAIARRLDDASNDFCFDPAVSPDCSTVTWQAWSIPDMPWDGSRLVSRQLVGETIEVHACAGAAQQPQYMPDGRLICVRDDSGWNNVWLDGAALIAEPFEHAGPSWGLGQRSFAVSPDGAQLAFTQNERGFGRLCVMDLATRTLREVARGVHGQLSWRAERLGAIRTGARTPTQVVVYDTATWDRTVIDVGPVSGWEHESLVEPEAQEVIAADGTTLYARLYRADEPSDRLLCWLHGGPTDQWQVTFMPRLAFWRSRGWNVLVPDHRGSTGHGRAYQQAARGRWGEIDVSDICDVLVAAHAGGWGTSRRTVLMGGSAGGFTVLGVLARSPDLVAAAVVSYPVTDLIDLAERSHRFERHYTTTLVGPVPSAGEPLGPYHDRSPVNFAEHIRTPLLMFHGDADPVVPIEQSRAMATRIVESGGMVQLCEYAGEGHGFRQPLNQLDEYRRVAEFISDYVG
jgi:dipeptidyl aminopeptidase/acylaminoacyl peptidase